MLTFSVLYLLFYVYLTESSHIYGEDCLNGTTEASDLTFTFRYENDFLTEKRNLNSSKPVYLVLRCWNKEPIDIIWDYDPRKRWQGLEWARAYREFRENFKDYKNPDLNYYSSLLSINFKGLYENFWIGCYSVNDPCDRSFIEGKATSNTSFDIFVTNKLSPEILNGIHKVEENWKKSLEQAKLQSKCDMTFVIQLSYETNYINAKCVTSEGDIAKLFGFTVTSTKVFREPHTTGVIIENMFRSTQKADVACVRYIKSSDPCDNCTSFQADNFAAPTIIHCSLGNTSRVHRFFYSMKQTSRDVAKIYNSWNEIDPTKMISAKVRPAKVYLNEAVQIQCYFSRTYFSHTYVVLLENTHGKFKYVKLFDSDGPGDTDEYYARVITQNVKISDANIHKVYCIGPVWNTTEWANVSIPLRVNLGDIPVFRNSLNITGTNVIEKVEFESESSSVVLVCKVEATKPQPEYTWNISSNAIEGKHYDIIPFASGSSELTFREKMKPEFEGEYVCISSNTAGQATKRFQLSVLKASNYFLILVISFTVLMLILVICAAYLVWVYVRQNRLIQYQQEGVITEFINGIGQNGQKDEDYAVLHNIHLLCLPYSDKYEIPSHAWNIDTSWKLGEGEYGVVYNGSVLKDNKTIKVAVKTVKSNAKVLHFQSILSELKILALLPFHDNIVNIIAASTAQIKKRQVYIGIEFCANGSLLDFLRDRGEYKFNIHKLRNGDSESDFIYQDDLLKWSLDVTSGLDFLSAQKVVHGDLAARNVLIAHNFTAKISDFGLSRHLGNYLVYKKKTKCALPLKWMSIESIKDMIFSEKSDMWALGIVFWEIYSLGSIPYSGMTATEYLTYLTEGNRLESPSHFTPQFMFEIMNQCWEEDPSKRPEAGDLIFKMQVELDALQKE